MRKILALAAIVAAAPSAHAADSFYDRYVIGPDGIPPCYARTYTKQHLADHPRQKVTRFYVTRSEFDTGRPAGAFDLAFGFLLKGTRDVFVAEAHCTSRRPDRAACLVEGDGGGFFLTPRPDGMLVTVDERLEIEGVDSFSPNLADSDDREFRLYASHPEDCLFDAFGER